jgi:hypothetical protein
MRIEFFALATLLLAGCAGQTFAPEMAPEYVAISDESPLYRFGPQQGGAPEGRLKKGDRVRMLRKEFGYSFVEMSDGLTGYVANMDLAPAPPLAEAPPMPMVETPDALPSVPPPVEPPLPKPDLDATPADAPAR